VTDDIRAAEQHDGGVHGASTVQANDNYPQTTTYEESLQQNAARSSNKDQSRTR